jgi:hypothetical protein
VNPSPTHPTNAGVFWVGWVLAVAIGALVWGPWGLLAAWVGYPLVAITAWLVAGGRR